MKFNLMDRYEAESRIHAKRFEIMQHYLFLYGARLKGKKSLYERFNDEDVLSSSEEGKACVRALMDVQKDEKEMESLLKRFDLIIQNQLEEIK